MAKYLDVDPIAHKFRALEKLARDRRDTKTANGIALCAAHLEGEIGDDVAPVVHAHWIRLSWVKTPHEPDDGYWIVKCSACGRPNGNEGHKFCPNCGAKMDEEVN